MRPARPTGDQPWPARTGLAVRLGNLAARLSRVTRLGEGGVIGGRITLAVQPDALAQLTRGRKTVLVTGTNGKTTTTGMIAHAVSTLGPVACNDGGANMPDGLVAALARDPHAPYCVLEVDEGHLPLVLKHVSPDVVVLLNLSRDQIDRVGEVRHTERALRAALADNPAGTVVANCDDVLVTSIATATAHPVWVAAGGSWRADAAACPRCGAAIHDPGGQWWCDSCGLSRPKPDWEPEPHGVRTPDGQCFPLAIGVPGQANMGNAVLAVAAATALGVPLLRALYQVGSINDVAGRYRVMDYRRHRVRLLLAKNPAGWLDTLSIVTDRTRPVVLAINAKEADGRDPSWLWDVSFDRLAGRKVIACGERAADLAVRLTYAEVAYTRVDDPLVAINRLPPGPVDVIGNYTAFREVRRRISHAH